MVRANQEDEAPVSVSSTEPAAAKDINVTIGPREVLRGRDDMPFVVDASLATRQVLWYRIEPLPNQSVAQESG
jgi:hypothetical protein